MRTAFLAKPIPGELHVWRIPTAGDPVAVADCLSRAETERLGAQPRRKRPGFAISHGCSRQILAAYLGVRPLEVPLRAEYGRAPSVPQLRLSLSHADGLALLAVSGDAVGVDLEPTASGHDEDLEDVAEATLSETELHAFRDTPPAGRPAHWLRSWVRKEALLKAHEMGISDRVPSLVDVAEDQQGEIRLRDLDLGPGYAAAIASEPLTIPPRIREWSHEPI